MLIFFYHPSQFSAPPDLAVVMRFTSLAATIFLAAFTAGFDADEKDATGCPKVFQGKCHCNKQRYHFWKPDEETFVVNCTNTRFNSK